MCTCFHLPGLNCNVKSSLRGIEIWVCSGSSQSWCTLTWPHNLGMMLRSVTETLGISVILRSNSVDTMLTFASESSFTTAPASKSISNLQKPNIQFTITKHPSIVLPKLSERVIHMIKGDSIPNHCSSLTHANCSKRVDIKSAPYLLPVAELVKNQ